MPGPCPSPLDVADGLDADPARDPGGEILLRQPAGLSITPEQEAQLLCPVVAPGRLDDPASPFALLKPALLSA